MPAAFPASLPISTGWPVYQDAAHSNGGTMKPLTGAEMRKALDEAEQMAARIGRPVVIVHNRRWDCFWRGPWRVVEAREAARGDVIVRDVQPGQPAAAPSHDADARQGRAVSYMVNARRADLPGYQEPRS